MQKPDKSKQVFLVMPTSSKAQNIKKQCWDIRKILSSGEVLLTGKKKNCLFSRVDKVDLQPDGTDVAFSRTRNI